MLKNKKFRKITVVENEGKHFLETFIKYWLPREYIEWITLFENQKVLNI